MNVEELHELAEMIVSDIETLNLLALLTDLRDAVQAQVSNPSHPDIQTSVANARAILRSALGGGAIDEFNARWRTLMDELGIGFLRSDEMLEWLDNQFLQNQVTPQAIFESLSTQVAAVAAALDHLKGLLSALAHFTLASGSLQPGEFEAAVMIPRVEVDNSLGRLGKEFQDLETLIRPFVEAATGSAPPIEVKQIASSEFVAVVMMVPAAALMLSKAIDGVLAVYERVLNIRKLRGELGVSGLSAATVAAIEKDATDLVELEVPKIVQAVLETAASTSDPGRRHEIEIAIDKSVRGIAKRVDVGFRLSVRAGPVVEVGDDADSSGNGVSNLELATIREIVVNNQRRAEMLEAVGEPILQALSSAYPVAVDSESAPSTSPEDEPRGKSTRPRPSKKTE
jgi:hypothetical protein